jgi:selenocysteine-specific elongation factor
MIAGASGIDLALLVVAADEGIMPQTREHLEVIRLMGVRGGAIALTKIDTVDEETAELAGEEIKELLAGTPFDNAPVVRVSATTGAGLDELRRTLVEQVDLATAREVDARPFRQPVDRGFFHEAQARGQIAQNHDAEDWQNGVENTFHGRGVRSFCGARIARVEIGGSACPSQAR